ncbi:hypothetical protein WR25_23019 [Diploscapter pachys]|uniref:Metalloendopeptidase n=1 Tax=Diploscapter pachys TaxID=2018661 RepID=A0A2A2LSV2_9BILA|nr:hypothetical protein WR25_23019 [Diploscapter pachys]
MHNPMNSEYGMFMWVGITRVNGSNQFIDAKGSEPKFFNWHAPNEPNNVVAQMSFVKLIQPSLANLTGAMGQDRVTLKVKVNQSICKNKLIKSIENGTSHCPMNFELISGSCYSKINDKVGHNEAEAACTKLHKSSHLAVFKNEKENDAVSKKPNNLNGKEDCVESEIFVDENGNVAKYFNWDKNEPNNVNGQEACVEVFENHISRVRGLMNDINCLTGESFPLCQIDPIPISKYEAQHLSKDATFEKMKFSYGFTILFLLLASVNSHEDHREKRQAAITLRKWAQNTVYYYLYGLSTHQNDIKNRVISKFQLSTCINFVVNATARNRIKIYSDPAVNGCTSSNIGCKAGEQTIIMGTNCKYEGQLAKAFMHALGFYRMEVRSDRDTYVTFNSPSVHPDLVAGIGAINTTYSSNLLPYNYGSVLHSSYDAYVYEGSTNFPLIPKTSNYFWTIGSGIISSYDLNLVNTFYYCNNSCTGTKPTCVNGGNVNTRTCDKCNCPLGYAGTTCNTKPSDGGQQLTATTAWQNLSITISIVGTSPETPVPYLTRTYWIAKPAGSAYVQFKYLSFSAFGQTECDPGCKKFGVEIRYNANQELTSPRACCDYFKNMIVSSNLAITPIFAYTTSYKTFVLQYRAAGANDSQTPPPEVYTTTTPAPVNSCPTGWDFILGNCYKKLSGSMTYDAAVSACAAANPAAKLPKIYNQAQNDALTSKYGYDFVLGIIRTAPGSPKFKYSDDGTSPSYYNWDIDNPDNNGGVEDSCSSCSAPATILQNGAMTGLCSSPKALGYTTSNSSLASVCRVTVTCNNPGKIYVHTTHPVHGQCMENDNSMWYQCRNGRWEMFVNTFDWQGWTPFDQIYCPDVTATTAPTTTTALPGSSCASCTGSVEVLQGGLLIALPVQDQSKFFREEMTVTCNNPGKIRAFLTEKNGCVENDNSMWYQCRYGYWQMFLGDGVWEQVDQIYCPGESVTTDIYG